MDAESLPSTAALPDQRDRELQELRELLARAESGTTEDDRCAARIFRSLIEHRSRP